MKNIIRILFTILGIWVIISLILITKNNKTITSNNYEIDELESNVKDFKTKISELENEKEDMENQINELEDNQQNEVISHSNDQIHFSNNSNSSFNGSAIDEKDAFLSLGNATIVFRKDGCDYMILESNTGFIVAQWMGGNDPVQGDNIAGNFKSYGSKEYFNMQHRSITKLWIDDYMLSKDDALEKINDKCN